MKINIFSGMPFYIVVNYFFVAVLLMPILSCGSGNSRQGVSSGGVIKLNIKSDEIYSGEMDIGKPASYHVEIANGDSDAPIVGEFSGDAKEGVIKGVPIGVGKIITVSAKNGKGQIIRNGIAKGIKILSGINDVDVDIKSVPIFTNISDGSVVDNTRLVFRIFSEPNHDVSIEDVSNGNAALPDISTGRSDVQSDISTWMASLSPPLPPAGKHTFRVKDLSNGEYSEVSVKLLDGTRMRPAPLMSASASKKGWFESGSIGGVSLSEVMK